MYSVHQCTQPGAGDGTGIKYLNGSLIGDATVGCNVSPFKGNEPGSSGTTREAFLGNIAKTRVEKAQIMHLTLGSISPPADLAISQGVQRATGRPPGLDAAGHIATTIRAVTVSTHTG